MHIIKSSLFLGATANSRLAYLQENQVIVISSRDRLLAVYRETSVKNVYNLIVSVPRSDGVLEISVSTREPSNRHL